MGRPIQSKWFGLGEDKIRLTGVMFKDGTVAENAVVFEQTGTRSYMASDSEGIRQPEIVTLVEKTSTELLTPGEAFITVETPYGFVPVNKIQQYKLKVSTEDGTIRDLKWHDKAGGRVDASLPARSSMNRSANNRTAPTKKIKVVETPEVAETPDTGAVGVAIRDLTGDHLNESGNIHYGLNNPADGFAVSDKNGIELALRVSGRRQQTRGVSKLIGDVLKVSVPAEDFVGSDSTRRMTWLTMFSVLTKEGKLSDFDVEMVVEPFPGADRMILRRDVNGSWMFGDVMVMDRESTYAKTANREVVDQNTINLGLPFYDAHRSLDFSPVVPGVYHMELRVKKDGVVLNSLQVEIETVEGMTWPK